MHLAVLGTDPDILALVAAAKSLGHEIAWLGDVRPVDAAGLAALAPGLPTPSADWEMLLDQATVNAVLIGRGQANADLRAEQLKRLATDAVPMLVVHPICDSVLTYYEVDMIRRETRGLIQHYNPIVLHPIFDYFDLVEKVQKTTKVSGLPTDRNLLLEMDRLIGSVHQISCERLAPDLSREATQFLLARDAEIIQVAAGSTRRVSAMGPQSTDSSYASLIVQLSTVGPQSLRWSAIPQSHDNEGVKLTFVGENGIISIFGRDTASESKPFTWIEELRESGRKECPLPTFDAPAAAIKRLTAALIDSNPERRAAESTWDKATQSMEVVDAIELSLQKGRTMEVHQQQLTEQLAFRGTMAAMGCGLLLVGFAVLVFAASMGGIETVVDKKLIPAWPIVLLAVLAFFLLLQALPLLIPKTTRAAKQEANPSHPN